MNSGNLTLAFILDLAFVALFYGMAFRALSRGEIRLNLGTFSWERTPWAYGFCVAPYLLLGMALVFKAVSDLLAAAG